MVTLSGCITLSPSQLGFLAGNRTSDAHIILYNLINDYCHKRGLKLYGCFVDFSKAFDSIPRDKMFKKLLDIGITGKFYNIIKFISGLVALSVPPTSSHL